MSDFIKIKCTLCGKTIASSPEFDIIECPNCGVCYMRMWKPTFYYKRLTDEQKLRVIKLFQENVYGGELEIRGEYAYIHRDSELAYKIDIATGGVVGGHQCPSTMDKEIFDFCNENELEVLSEKEEK